MCRGRAAGGDCRAERAVTCVRSAMYARAPAETPASRTIIPGQSPRQMVPDRFVLFRFPFAVRYCLSHRPRKPCPRKDSTARIRKITNRIFAPSQERDATPANPKKPAINAITKNTIAQCNMIPISFKVVGTRRVPTFGDDTRRVWPTICKTITDGTRRVPPTTGRHTACAAYDGLVPRGNCRHLARPRTIKN